MELQYLHFLLQCTYSTFIACLHRTGLSTSLTRYTGVCVSSPSRVLIRNGVCGRVAVRFLLVFCVWHVQHLLTLQPHRIGVQFSGSCIGENRLRNTNQLPYLQVNSLRLERSSKTSHLLTVVCPVTTRMGTN
ncbi:hypothetical protein KC19_10G120300 [Ceratodon purpureus]|uniref:Uncharacterized protein n=1 Tax=Ceratodon purpureus TaxID=3225 RepID=A0A8T0GM78_CERPU|nr:hypothetical protein KC19_10G120300 [Ceratodon purpureus]